ncbi:MFS transporter [Brucella intermedia]|uniref:Major facilitator transporter n=1 Tax=Brucella intermedia M86 TaxID=1234597 RepID=M5JL84_9HYPH|nr:MFS transporter [Brucella intermedia]ELT47455.1 major facilitator transporter [Brucella intermedia M86]
MSSHVSTAMPENDERPAYWGGVFAMSLCVFALIASEFMPVSLLTPIAAELDVSEGQAGQAIAISGAFAVMTSLVISAVAGRLDRKTLLVALTGVMAVSGTIVALAPNYWLFMVGRALIGVVIGGFWSMSAATAMRLVPERQVPRALAIFNGGNALATVIAPPLGAFLGSIIGWRGAFFTVVPVAIIVFLWQMVSLPTMQAERRPGSSNVLTLFQRPVVMLGMAAVGLFFMGQFALFTYVRPFLETVTRVDVSTLSLILLCIGVAGVVGTSLIGGFLKDGLYQVLIVTPIVMAVIATILIVFGRSLPVTVTVLCVWGFIGTAAPVGWWTWLARSLPHDAEAGGGLMVAVIQLAITLGAVAGGILFDLADYKATFAASAVLLLLGAALTVRTRGASQPH